MIPSSLEPGEPNELRESQANGNFRVSGDGGLCARRGILGGDVTLTAKVNDRSEGVCEFSRQQGAAVRQLVVSVNVMTDISKQFRTYLAQCPPKSDPIRAIGNEAVTCTSQGKGHSSAEIVVGRVRDQAFVVSLSSSVGDDPSMTQEMRRQKVNLVAEQIAGILF